MIQKLLPHTRHATETLRSSIVKTKNYRVVILFLILLHFIYLPDK
jgi:hypothetical protein